MTSKHTGRPPNCYFATAEMGRRIACRVLDSGNTRRGVSAAVGITGPRLEAFIRRTGGLNEREFTRLMDVLNLCE